MNFTYTHVVPSPAGRVHGMEAANGMGVTPVKFVVCDSITESTPAPMPSPAVRSSVTDRLVVLAAPPLIEMVPAGGVVSSLMVSLATADQLPLASRHCT
jgi:hypothetical protein